MLTIGNKRYPCGAALDPNATPPMSLQAMIQSRSAMSAFGGKADIDWKCRDVCF